MSARICNDGLILPFGMSAFRPYVSGERHLLSLSLVKYAAGKAIANAKPAPDLLFPIAKGATAGISYAPPSPFQFDNAPAEEAEEDSD
jgi:hypothetical protein